MDARGMKGGTFTLGELAIFQIRSKKLAKIAHHIELTNSLLRMVFVAAKV